MKTIKRLSIKVTYTVAFDNVEVSDEVYDALAHCYDYGGDIPMPDSCILKGEPELSCASEWVSDNIRENDAMDWEYEVDDFDE